MELNKENIKKILFIIIISIIVFLGIQNIGIILGFFVAIINILKPFIIGICIAFILNVLINIIETKFIKNKKERKWIEKIKRPVSLIISILFLLLIIFFVVFLVIPELISTVNSIISHIPDTASGLKDYVVELTQNYPQIEGIIENLNIDWTKIDENTIKTVQGLAGNVLTFSFDIIKNIFAGVANFIISLIFAIYILLQKEKLSKQLKKLMEAYLKDDLRIKILRIANTANDAFTRFLTGQVTEACILGILCFLGMFIFRMPYALTISVLIGFTALIPIFGAFFGAIVGFLLISVQNVSLAFGFILFIIILQQIEGNVIYPRVVGSSVGLPSIWVLVAVTIFGSIWGIAGIAISVPIASMIYALLKENVARKIEKKETIS